jgi:MoxR-like ATPase
VQSALLEAMQERQVTLAGDTRKLPDPFLVLATQNPVEQEGTYALPEAQIDRFMVKLVVGYPSKQEEAAHHRPHGRPDAAQPEVQPATTPEELLRMRRCSTRSTSTTRSRATSSTWCSRRASRRRSASPS